MARVKGVKEKLHMPLYDSFVVEKGSDFLTEMGTDQRMIRFFMDVQGKTKLETNMQAAGVLPSLNSFEARAMRVVAAARSFSYGDEPTPVTADEFLAELIYNSVTSLLVGEKVSIEMPTFFFPSGAGVTPGNGLVANNGEPDPMATFRFAEPVIIEPQQNFRVEILFPQGVPPHVAKAPGLIRTWVVLDGFLTRDVQ